MHQVRDRAAADRLGFRRCRARASAAIAACSSGCGAISSRRRATLGCRSIWLAGISLGGFIALDYAADLSRRDWDGLCLLAPYLGNRMLIDEIAGAAGLAGLATGSACASRTKNVEYGASSLRSPQRRAAAQMQAHVLGLRTRRPLCAGARA